MCVWGSAARSGGSGKSYLATAISWNGLQMQFTIAGSRDKLCWGGSVIREQVTTNVGVQPHELQDGTLRETPRAARYGSR